MLVLMAVAAAGATPDPVLARMVALYDEICLQSFPIDAAVDALMAKKDARPLTADEVKVTLRDDPGRGWAIKDGERTITVFIELPPYHACSVRRGTDAGFADLGAYRTVADPFEAAHRGFAPMAPMEGDLGDIHVHAIGEQRTLPGGGAESLFVFDQHITDPAKRNAGQTGVEVRFVHQIKTGG